MHTEREIPDKIVLFCKSTLLLLASLSNMAFPQTKSDTSGIDASYHFQETMIEQAHDKFNSPYSGMNSLSSSEPPALTVTSTLFFALSLPNQFEIEIDPELGGGKGLSGSTGIAGVPNGESYRINDVAPKVELVRAYLHKTISVGPLEQYDFVAGKFSVTDYFDVNTYSNSARTEFMNGAIINNGAWDYPADTRGYTEGLVAEYIKDKLALRLAAVLEPTSANGPNLDSHISKAHGEALEGEYGYDLLSHGGKVRLLLFLNTAKMGNYNEATYDSIYNHDITLTRKYSRNKYGFGINMEQSLNDNAGAFLRIGWNDGQNETWAYTEIDRTVSGGIATKMPIIGREEDSFGIAFTIDGISAAHRAYLNSGGYGFIIGDGKLPHYGLESIMETYYLFQLNKLLGISFDYQFVANPAYNEDRGPVNIFSIRGHVEL
jgi:high affinity Mn2+ porin